MLKKVVVYKKYYHKFIKKLESKQAEKLTDKIMLLATEKPPEHFIKHIRDKLFEFRVGFGNNEFRIFFINDGDKVVVLLNCFVKKTQKTPKKEINLAMKLKKEYEKRK